MLLHAGALQQPTAGGLLAGRLGSGCRRHQGQGGRGRVDDDTVGKQRLRLCPAGLPEQRPPPAGQCAGARIAGDREPDYGPLGIEPILGLRLAAVRSGRGCQYPSGGQLRPVWRQIPPACGEAVRQRHCPVSQLLPLLVPGQPGEAGQGRQSPVTGIQAGRAAGGPRASGQDRRSARPGGDLLRQHRSRHLLPRLMPPSSVRSLVAQQRPGDQQVRITGWLRAQQVPGGVRMVAEKPAGTAAGDLGSIARYDRRRQARRRPPPAAGRTPGPR